jgi:hypothetical protein
MYFFIKTGNYLFIFRNVLFVYIIIHEAKFKIFHGLLRLKNTAIQPYRVQLTKYVIN